MTAQVTGESLSDEERALYGALADVLVPNAVGMPSASQADVNTHWIDVALKARPDLTPMLRQALQLAEGLPAEDAVESINHDHPAVFDALGTITAGAYLLNPRVKELIGYPGQIPQPVVDDVESYLDLLEHVVERGPIYREVEPSDNS
jgi:hypothetical protein